MINALTVDVEEYFHPTEIQLYVHNSSWLSLPSRIEQQIDRTLEMLDEYGVSATFFILGWIAEYHPRVVRRILAQGHELGCHSYGHQLVYRMTPAEVRDDTLRALAAISNAAGVRPRLYRAPSYSITVECMWALEILVECGFTHDSSIYPIHHDRYGIPSFGRHATTVHTPAGPIQEIPVGTVKVGNRVAPIGGGAYLRMLPFCYTAAGIRRVNEMEQKPVCIYFHPWEMDPEHPRLASGAVARARTYTGLRGMEQKIRKLLRGFRFSTLTSVYAGDPVEQEVECLGQNPKGVPL